MPKTYDFSHLNSSARNASPEANAAQILNAGRRARGEKPLPGMQWAHLLGGYAGDNGDEPDANVSATEIVRAAQKARMPTNGPAPTGTAKQILGAGKKHRGEV